MTTLPIPVMDAAAQRDLATAHALLENPGVAAQLANALGAPIESLITKRLPKVVTRSIDGVTRRAPQVAMKSALLSLRGKADAQQPASTTRHTLAVGVSGGAGGFFGLPGLMVELPVTTTVMLRSIADIAVPKVNRCTTRTPRWRAWKCWRMVGAAPATTAPNPATSQYVRRWRSN